MTPDADRPIGGEDGFAHFLLHSFMGPRSDKSPEAHFSVIYFGMTITRAEMFFLPQRSTELVASAENTSDGSIWFLYVGVQSVNSRIETEAELDS